MRVACCIAALLTLAVNVNGQDKTECSDDMITYTYTECEENKGRWRVAVPRNDQCKITKPPPPVFGKECGFSCGRGHYLDLSTQECKLCPPGTFSIGSGFRFSRWDSLPEGFTVSTTSFSFTEYGYHSKVSNCTSSGWKAQKDYISSNDNDCISSLSYAVNVKSKGSVTFTYQHTDDDLIFHFYVQNSECKAFHSNGRNVFLNTTGTSWHTYKVDLDEGTNVLIWKTTGLLFGSKRSLRPALIKVIEVSGVSYTTTCHQCLPGYYSDTNGADWCKPCPMDSYSEVGAGKCLPCNKDTHYSMVASSSCTAKLPCTKSDYFETHSRCNEDKKTEVTYKWREPKICRDDMDESVKLPESGALKECPPCNPGFHPDVNGGCAPCGQGSYSDGKDCQLCSVGTSPNHVFHYKWWDSLPSNMRVSCMTVHSEDCLGMDGWIPSSGMIETSLSEIPVAYLLLKLKLDGFHSYKTGINGVRDYGNLTFVFELKCKSNCVLYLMKNSDKGGTSVIGNWHGETKKTSFVHTFNQDESMNLTWAFQKTNLNDPKMQDIVGNDRALIYSIVVTNALGAPSTVCDSCAAGMNKDGCIPCPAGHFVDSSKKQCSECPPNTYLPTQTILDSNCTACLHGTLSNKDHTACENDCKYTSELTGRKYDFSTLSDPQIAVTPPSFSANGRKYVHYFNFSVCGNNGFGEAQCVDNKSLSRNLIYGTEKVQGMVCRSTKLFTAGVDNEEVPVFSQPILISSILQSVYHTNASLGADRCDSTLFPYTEGQDKVGDVIYLFATNDQSDDDCPGGMKAYLHLRCDPNIARNDAVIETPTKYPDGSCDGCNFHFLWKSIEACPVCTEDDYDTVVGACESGYVTTKYMWKSYPKSCKDGVPLPSYTKNRCIDMKFYAEIGILAGIVLLVVLLAVSCAFWKKSRKLEYKYQKLVMDSSSPGGELPAADSCAISSSESGDSGDEDVMFRKKRQKMLKKSNDEKIPLNSMHHSINM